MCHRVVLCVQSGIINTNQLDLLRQHEFTLLARLRPNAVALVDAFDWRDETLCSALGRHDGRVYEALYDMAKESPMSKQVVCRAYLILK